MTYRIYFHKRDGDDPVVWSIDEGTQQSEIHVQWVTIEEGLCGITQVNLKAQPGEPCAWLLVDRAKLHVINGGAVLSPIVEIPAA